MFHISNLVSDSDYMGLARLLGGAAVQCHKLTLFHGNDLGISVGAALELDFAIHTLEGADVLSTRGAS